jgi:hypothetical protein
VVYATAVLALEEDGVVENDRLSFETEFFSAARAHSVRSDPFFYAVFACHV